MTGGTIGRYEVLERIGIGGMGEVFRGRASGVEGFRKDVVIKVVLPEMQGEPELERAFVDEAKLSVQLQHPNIVQTLDLGKHEGRLYLVMEHVDGHDLGFVLRAMRRRDLRMPVPLAVYVGIELLRGLDHAHRAADAEGKPLEIIHRDVTPGNVMVSFTGTVKLADFGIARFASRTQRKTTTGFVKGKVAYMPPEQVESRPLVPATDVFSAALVIVTLLAGEHPLESASDAELMDRIRAGDIPLPDGIPRALDEILARALAPRLEDRTASAGAMLDALETFVLDQHVRTGPAALAAFLADLFHEELARRNPAAAGEPPARRTETLAELRPDPAVPATMRRPAAPSRRWVLVLAPIALVAAGAGGLLGRERWLLRALRRDCAGEWRVTSLRDVQGGVPGDPLARGEDRRLLLGESAVGGLRLSFRTGADETLSVPLDLEREGATLLGRYNGVPVKFWPGDAGGFGRAKAMNLRVRLRPLGTVLQAELTMFGEGLPLREWTLTAQRP